LNEKEGGSAARFGAGDSARSLLGGEYGEFFETGETTVKAQMIFFFTFICKKSERGF